MVWLQAEPAHEPGGGVVDVDQRLPEVGAQVVRPFAMAGRAPDPAERGEAGIADVVDREQGIEVQELLRRAAGPGSG